MILFLWFPKYKYKYVELDLLFKSVLQITIFDINLFNFIVGYIHHVNNNR